MTKNSETMQNHTNQRSDPVVSRRRLTPNEILEKVDAKQDIEAPTEMPTAIIGRFSTGMSAMCLPKPKCWPTCVRMASKTKRTCACVRSQMNKHGMQNYYYSYPGSYEDVIIPPQPLLSTQLSIYSQT